MNQNEVTSTQGGDVIDAVVGLKEGDPLFAVRHAREKVSSATQASYDLFFGQGSAAFPVHERLIVAWYACLLSRSESLARHYEQKLQAFELDAALRDAVRRDALGELAPSRLSAMLAFTRKLITRPVDGDEVALKALTQAGIATPDVVTLAQLVAFLSYQIRLAAGLAAMKALEAK
jgi:CMD domain protein